MIECDAEEWLEGARIELHYRAAGKEGYTAVAMEAVPKGPLRGKVPAAEMQPPFTSSITSRRRSEGAGVVAAAGGHDSPSVVRVQAAAPTARRPSPAAPSANPTRRRPSRRSRGWHASPRARRGPRARSGWGCTLGSGYGWSSRSRLEYRSDLEAGAGFGPAGLAHLSPEVGYQLTPKIAVALAGRHQFISGGGGRAGLSRPARALGPRRAGARPVHRRLGPLRRARRLPGGRGRRLPLSLRARSGVRPAAPRHDPRAGPWCSGPARGSSTGCARVTRWSPRANLLFGVPDFALMTDVTLGVQVNL